MANTIEHLSPSTVQSYRTCGKQVYFNKIMGVDNPVKYAMTSYGSSMHKAIEKLYKEKLSEENFCKAFADEWSELSTIVNNWKTDSPGHLLEQGIIACKDFYENVYGKYDVDLVEQKFDINRGDGSFPILCYADAITKDGVVIDYKFGRGLTGVSDSKAYSCNMATYAWGYREMTGELPKKIVFVKEKWRRKKDPVTKKMTYFHDSFVIDESPVTESSIEFYRDVYENVEVGIQAGVWLPAPDDSFFCKSCGYRIMGICDKEVPA